MFTKNDKYSFADVWGKMKVKKLKLGSDLVWRYG